MHRLNDVGVNPHGALENRSWAMRRFNRPAPISTRPSAVCTNRCGTSIRSRPALQADAERRDLLEVIEDRSERASTLIASPLPPTAWHAAIGEPSVADAICNRLIHQAHRLTLKGPTMRDPGTRRSPKGTS